MLETQVRCFQEDLDAKRKDLEAKCLGDAFLDNANILADENLQKTLIDNPSKAQISEDLTSISALSKSAELLHREGVFINAQVKSRADAIKDLAKKQLAFGYCLRKVLRDLPDDLAQARNHVTQAHARTPN
jgi:hypothetical protein